jgi:hypothetical protein
MTSNKITSISQYNLEKEKCKSIYWNLVELLELRRYDTHRDVCIFKEILETKRCDSLITNLSKHRKEIKLSVDSGIIKKISDYETTENDEKQITNSLNIFSPVTSKLLVSSLPWETRMYYHMIFKPEKEISYFFSKIVPPIY